MMERYLGLRLKRAIGFGLMVGTTGAVFWYVLALARAADDPALGALLFGVVLAGATALVAYLTIYKRLPRR